jgi:hypothetical protein
MIASIRRGAELKIYTYLGCLYISWMDRLREFNRNTTHVIDRATCGHRPREAIDLADGN